MSERKGGAPRPCRSVGFGRAPTSLRFTSLCQGSGCLSNRQNLNHLPLAVDPLLIGRLGNMEAVS